LMRIILKGEREKIKLDKTLTLDKQTDLLSNCCYWGQFCQNVYAQLLRTQIPKV